MTLAERLHQDIKTAMRARDSARLGVLRMALAAIRQREVDTRAELSEPDTVAIIEKLVRQGRDSAAQYRQAGRNDLADKEAAEVDVLETYLPAQLDEAGVDALIAAAIAETGAESVRDMGRVMAAIKAKAAGSVDMSAVGAKVRAALGAG